MKDEALIRCEAFEALGFDEFKSCAIVYECELYSVEYYQEVGF